MAEKPNIVVLWTDQQATRTLGAYGNSTVETPNIDSLASEGTLFNNAYVTQSLCGPSRATVMTGQYPHRTGITENNIPLRETTPCLPEMGDLDEYTTGWIGKWHLGNEIFPQHGFDEWIAVEDHYWMFYDEKRPQHATSAYHDYLLDQGYEPDRAADGHEWFSRGHVASSIPEEHSKPAFMAREAKRFIRENRDNPFILYVMFLEPHPPYTSPRDDQYAASDVQLPPNFHHDNFDEQVDRVQLTRETIRNGDVTINSFEPFLSSPPEPREWREMISNYWGLASLVDTYVGEILDTLDENGLRDNTVTVYTSDHGDMMGSHQLAEKMMQFEEAIKVPLIIQLSAGENQTEVVEHPVSQIDLVPTLLDAAEQPRPNMLPGKSWIPALTSEEPFRTGPVVVEWNGSTNIGIRSIATRELETTPYAEESMKRAHRELDLSRDILDIVSDPVRTIIMSDGWKLNYRRSGDHELYNLSSDPYETENLAPRDDYREVVDDLYRTLVEWQWEHRDPVSLY